MGKYNFAVTRRNKVSGLNEELQVVGCDSFDEARKVVEKAVYDRELQEHEELEKRRPAPVSPQSTEHPPNAGSPAMSG